MVIIFPRHLTWSGENLKSTPVEFQDVAVIVLEMPLNEWITAKQLGILR
jgi:hypothetical protein